MTPPGTLASAALSWTLVPATMLAGAPEIVTVLVRPAIVTAATGGLVGNADEAESAA